LHSTIRQFAQCYLILAHSQLSKFYTVYTLSPFNAGKASHFVCLYGCAVAYAQCATKQTFVQYIIFLEGTLDNFFLLIFVLIYLRTCTSSIAGVFNSVFVISSFSPRHASNIIFVCLCVCILCILRLCVCICVSCVCEFVFCVCVSVFCVSCVCVSVSSRACVLFQACHS